MTDRARDDEDEAWLAFAFSNERPWRFGLPATAWSYGVLTVLRGVFIVGYRAGYQQAVEDEIAGL